MATALETHNSFTSEVEEDTFRWFNYNIVGMFCEYLNDVEHHSYDKLTDNWWLTIFRELDIINNAEKNSEDIQKNILEKVQAEFSKDFLTKEQLDELKKNLQDSYQSFIIENTTPIHHCRIPGCDGDCGIQSCGICIDYCSCYRYW